MTKCNNCDKIITKKSIILECSRCEIVVHATNQCTGLSSKQLTALRNAENLEWTCNDCNQNSSKRKSFVTLAEVEDDCEEDVGTLYPSTDLKKLLADIRREVHSVVTQEMQSLTKAVEFCSGKMEDMTETMDAYASKMKDMERKQLQLQNKNVYLESKVQALEQRVGEMEQLMLSCYVEIAGIPECAEQDLPRLVENVANKLNLPKEEIISAKRLRVRKSGSGPVLVKLREEKSRNQFIAAARKNVIKAGNLINDLTGETADEKIFVREALTPYNKNLLWQAKQELKGVFQFVWCREGCVLARKSENTKVFKIRSKDDIVALLK